MKRMVTFLILITSLNALSVIDGAEDNDGRFQNIVKISGITLCTGTVISPYLVLTAAHCVHDGRVPLNINSFATGQKIKPAKVIPHPSAKFHETQSRLLEGQDIALVVLETPIEIPVDNIIPLAGKRDVKVKDGRSIEVVGIGIDESGWPHGRPKIAKTEIDGIPFWKCGGNARKTFSGRDVVRSGDSGGGAFSTTKDGSLVQVGVTSSRMIFDYENEYLPPEEQKEVDCKNKSVFMKTESFLGWIEKETGYHPNKIDHDQITKRLKSRFDLKNETEGLLAGCHRKTVKFDSSMEDFLGQLGDVISELREKCSVDLLVTATSLTETEVEKILNKKAYSVNKEAKQSYKVELVEGKETFSLRIKASDGKSIYSSVVRKKLFERGGVEDFLGNLPFCQF